MKRTRTLATILVLLMVITIVFAGCKKAEEDTTTSAAPEKTEETVAETDETMDEEAPEEMPKLSTDPVTIEFWNGWTGSDGVLLEELVDFYNANNEDGVTVVMDRMQHAALSEKLAAALLSGTACEISIAQALSDYAVNGQTIPIDDIWDLTPLDKDDFIPDILDQCYYDGKLYGLPFQLSSTFLYWNKDIFEQYGLDPESPPKTYDEMYEMGLQMTDPDNNIYGGGFYISGAFMQNVVQAYGGELLIGNQEEGFRPVFTDPEYVDKTTAALEWLKKMLDDGVTPPYQQDENVAMFLAGTVGMMTNGAWLVAGCKESLDNWGIGLLPAGPEGMAQSGFPLSLVVFKTAEGRTLEASYQFLSYWNNNLTQTLQEQSPAMQWTVYLGYQPYLYSVVNDPVYQNDPITQITGQYVDYYVKIYPDDFPGGFAYFFTVCDPLMQAVAVGTPIPEALQQAQEATQELCDMYNN